MVLSDEAIKEFKEIYYKDYGIKLDDGEALELASRIFVMLKTVFGAKNQKLN